MTSIPLPHLGFDPAPGDLYEIRSVARTLADAAREVTSAHQAVDTAGSGSWVGQSATAFHDHLQSKFAPMLRNTANSFEQASSTVTSWAASLDDFQSRAESLEHQAAAAAAKAGDAASYLAHNAEVKVDQTADAAATQAANTANAARAAQQQAHDAANAELRKIIERAHDLHDEVRSRAKHLADELNDAKDMAPDEPGLFSRIAHAIGNGLNAAWEWTKAHADVIKMVGDVLSTISGVLGVIAILTAPFEPIGAIFGAAALATGALALGAHLLAKAAGANVSWTTIGLDALGCIPGIGGAAKAAKAGTAVKTVAEAGRAAKIVGEGGELVRSTGRVFSLGGREFGGATKFAIKGGEDLAGQSRAALATIDQGLQKGQLIGTKGINFVAGKLPGVTHDLIAPMSVAGRLTDAGIKVVPKLYTTPITFYNDFNPQHPLSVTHPGQVFDHFLHGGK